ncbi:hypothetical protein LTR16_005921, partial [Cryomyces antarcticus]
MPPKKTGAAAPKKAAGAAPAHASYQDMIREAISNLKERSGSSRQAIKKYIQANNQLPPGISDAQFSSALNRAIKAGAEKGVFDQPKGASGPVKLSKKGDKSAAPKASSPTATKDAPKAAAAPKTPTKSHALPPTRRLAVVLTFIKKATKSKAAPAKKATSKASTTKAKAPTTTKAAPKKAAAAAKPKANVSKARKPAP